MTDPYVYPGTDVLRNRENIRDAHELEAFERTATANRMETLPDNTPITAEGYREIHRYIFQDVYDWAGQVRTVDIAKNDDLFCLAVYVDQELARRFEAIRAEDGLRDLSVESFVARAADHISELNAIHPFREGNGRTQRALSLRAGTTGRPRGRLGENRPARLERRVARELSHRRFDAHAPRHRRRCRTIVEGGTLGQVSL
jgi:cell filamentation protein